MDHSRSVWNREDNFMFRITLDQHYQVFDNMLCVLWIVTASFGNCTLISCWLYILSTCSVSIYRSVYSTNNASSTHSQSSTTDYNNIISLTDDDSDNRLSIGQLFSVHMSHDYKELSVYHYVIYHTAEEYQTRDLSLVVLWKPF